MSLAIDSYRSLASPGDSPDSLNLAWTLDERDFLSVDVGALASGCLDHEIKTNLGWTNRYLVQDPYGASALGDAVESFFGLAGLAPNVSCSAGVNSLLCALAQALRHKTVVLAEGIYPDFPHWIGRNGAHAVGVARDAGFGRWQSCLEDASCAAVFIERPAIAAGIWDDLRQVRALCELAARRGVALIVDESNANYCAPSYSAAGLTLEFDNLAVLRGLSKGYGMGGLRAGLCISSAALTPWVRADLAPLQTSSLSLLMARTLLQQGDILEPLRRRIGEMKARALSALCRAGTQASLCNDVLPYIFLPGPLTCRDGSPLQQIATKRHPLWSIAGHIAYVQRCSVPLREARMLKFEQLLAEGMDRMRP